MELLTTFLVFGFFIVALSWVVPSKYQVDSISISSFVFFAYLDWKSALLLLSLTAISYVALSRKFSKLLVVGFLGILLLLFVIVKINKSFDYDYTRHNLVLLGFSFYMFRLIHLNIEVYKRNFRNVNFRAWMHYLLFFPVLLVGPINRFQDFERELRRRRWDSGLFSLGLERVLYGFVKVVFFGNYLCGVVLEVYLRNSDLMPNTWLYTYLETFQHAADSYFQFAGYSDIAIGIASLMGVRVAENFNFPFLATSVGDFWKRWHISLSQWCRDYIYMPIASFSRLPILGIIISMLVLGLWHELSWRYILWAFVHGIAIVVWQLADDKLGGFIKNQKLKKSISWFFTFNFVILSFGIIKDYTIEEAIQTMKILLLLN